ncbi:GNAT family N-acetyltransferase [Sphingomonas sp. BAUL-RG-20F-R05-02]|uniref:GNAT family N-acetyltransferase n=1 Tax=Sphingomonas sp. BAUL-RG-20F-R05-02 TaxID=2914830 RepID=UPI001F59D03A|nr:GNAT family N-acetyltransferase [Sphingomonas sp. BAUL-RG-20F-R05-02]
MHLKSNDTLIGYFAIATAVENIQKLKGFHYHAFGEGRWFPCLHLVNVAVRDRYKGRDLGKILVGTAITIFAEIGPQIGLPHMILTPINADVIPFYEALGFEPYDGGARMFLPLQTAVQVVEQERARKAQIDALSADADAEPPAGANDSEVAEPAAGIDAPIVRQEMALPVVSSTS